MNITTHNATVKQAIQKVINAEKSVEFFAAWNREVLSLRHETINTRELRRAAYIDMFTNCLGSGETGDKRYNNSIRPAIQKAAAAVGLSIAKGTMVRRMGEGRSKRLIDFPLHLQEVIQEPDADVAPSADNSTTPDNGDTTGSQQGTAPAPIKATAETLAAELIAATGHGIKLADVLEIVIASMGQSALVALSRSIGKLIKPKKSGKKSEQQASEQQASEQQASEKAA